MGTRCTLLRRAVANLAATAEDQVAYLDRSFSTLTGGGSAEAYGNDELALEFEDSFIAVGQMLENGEVTQAEIERLRSLDELLDQWSGKSNAAFWARDALFSDPRWKIIRSRAADVFATVPDETREPADTRSPIADDKGG